ncbi:MAG TPA: hypothetical protein DEF48_20290 [Nostoc sp. UBA8866]|uniref:Uncharacterized protein n=1 Tax=Trichormus variabilis NIES-23 TaxID=1973479 RepID=A0A1Z4KL10_ANAVA|nr:hypothetical protein NIES23_24290 [Trichormus variabilis NIES-23]HBW32367.1 hypothetical protein [Nostoc sp. UBA8866]
MEESGESILNKNVISLISFIVAIIFSVAAIILIQSLNIPAFITLSVSVLSSCFLIIFIFIYNLISQFK